MVLDSIKPSKGPKLNDANAGGIDFTLSRESFDLMTSWYALDEIFYSPSFLCDRDVRHLVATRRVHEHDWKHYVDCFEKNVSSPFQARV
jgi:hypothetical protein